MLTKKCQKR
jgi:hypothetical protein